MLLEHQGGVPKQAASFEDVETALSALHPTRMSFMSLTAGDGSYVQVAGAKLRLTIEARRVQADGSFRHVVLGRPSGPTEEISINYIGGPVTVLRREVLSLTDATLVCRTFFESHTLPVAYVLRDTTSRFRSQIG